MSARLSSCLLLMVLVGCTFGPRLKNYPLATRPAGAQVEVATFQHPARIVGELLAVSDSALVLRSNDQLFEVPYRLIRAASSRDIGALQFGGGIAPNSRTRSRLAQRSRYPQGLSPSLLSELLRAYQQDRLLRPEGA